LLQAEGLAAFRGERLVFRDVGFSLEAGEALLLTGPNGSGKSTLLRLLAGLLRPAAGTLRWNGEDALADLSTHARRVGYVGHLDAIKPGLTAAENLAFAARLSDGSVPDALAGMGLEELADFLGVKKSILVNSGSSANLVAFAALTSHKLPSEKRIQPGDEVITCAAGFPTTVAPIIQHGAIPVFIDNNPITGNADVSRLAGQRRVLDVARAAIERSVVAALQHRRFHLDGRGFETRDPGAARRRDDDGP